MKIGLLECDHVNESLRHIAGDYRDMFASLFERYAPEIELISYDTRFGVFPTSLDECDGYITTGSRFSAYDDEPWINELKSFVRDASQAEKPFVGICFGHQILAEALDGQVKRQEWGIGAKPMTVLKNEGWMDPAQKSCSILYSHRDQVQRLPKDAVLLAEAPHCPVAMFRVGARMLGIQGHPEFSTAYVEALVRSRTEIIGEENVARADFRSTTDESAITRWIANFLQS